MAEINSVINLKFDAETQDALDIIARVTDDVRREALSLASVVVRDRLRANPDASDECLSVLAVSAVTAFQAGAAAVFAVPVSPDAAPAAPAS